MIFYDFFVRLYYIGIVIASLFYSKAKKWRQGRRDLFRTIDIPVHNRVIWMHCASLGEYEQGRPVLEALKQKYPSHTIVLTFFSPSGYEVRYNSAKADYVFYLPLDTAKNARLFLDRIHPECILFVKYEFWYHFINQAYQRNIPLYLISGIFRKQQWFFKWYGKSFRQTLNCFTCIFTQNVRSQELLSAYGISQVIKAGDTRYDRVFQIQQKIEPLPEIEGFTDGFLTIIAGSTWKADEELLIHYLNTSPRGRFKAIIAPHEIDAKEIQDFRNRLYKPSLLYSEMHKGETKNAEVLIIDNIGMLSQIYQYGDIAYIGGGFGKGIHNVLEPATFGMPVLFGPKYKKFDEAVELVKLHLAFPVFNKEQLTHQLDELLNHSAELHSLNTKIQAFIQNKTGATKTILEQINL